MMDCFRCGKNVPNGSSQHDLCIAESYRRRSLNLCEYCGTKPIKECYIACEECLGGNGTYTGYEDCFQE